MSQEPNLSKFQLFCSFLSGDNRLENATNWSFSIIGKSSAVNMAYREVLEQIPKSYAQMKEFEGKKLCGYEEFLKLTLKYEVFLSSIYGLFENLSYVVHRLYRRNNLPPTFHKQKNRLLVDLSVDADYSAILKDTGWYDEIRGMRDESTHFLSGLIIMAGLTQLGFGNIPTSTRKDAIKKYRVDDIEKHIKQLYVDALTFLSLFGEHFVNIINQEAKIAIPCVSADDKQIGVRGISLKECLSGEKWTCLGGKDCIARSACDTKKI